MCDCTTCNVFFYLMILRICTCWALVPYYQIDLAVCFMQQGIKFTEVWYIMWFFTSTLIWFDITHTSKIYFTWFHDVFSFQKFLTCRSHMLIKFSKRKFFLWNVKNNDRSGMNKQNTYTINTERKITLERVSYYENKFKTTPSILPASSFLWEKFPFSRITEGQLWHG